MLQRISLIAALSLSLLTSGLKASEELAATLMKATGQGRVYLPGGTEGAYKAGTMLKPGSRITTAEASVAVLMLEDGSRVNLGPNTDLTINEMSKDGDKSSTVFQLIKGLFRASVQKLTVASRFEVHTPDAVAAVKGTDYEVEVTDEGTDARVSEGKVWLEDAKRERRIEIDARRAARFERRTSRLRDSRDMSREEMKNFGEWVKASTSSHSGAYLPEDQAKIAAWMNLSPEERKRVWGDLVESLGGSWNDIVGLRDEERQEKWRDRLRNIDERNLAAEGARVDFALGKSVIDRQGRRVRFDEFLLRPAANQLQFLNYSRRGERVDLISSINTYNTALPRNLSEAKGMNQRLWLQGYANAPRYWVVDSALVAGNSANDSLAISTGFYDPYFRGLFWELPIKDVDVRLNIPDLKAPRSGGTQVEHWVRQANATTPANGLAAIGGAAPTAFRGVPGTTNNIGDINASNLVWGLGLAGTMPTTVLVDLRGLEAKPGDLAFGFKRTYVGGETLEFRSYVIDENGAIVNLAGIPPEKLMEEFVNRKLIASLKQIEIRSNQFKEQDGINIVSKLLFLHDLSKTRDEL